jgi:hypothetical protein
MTIENLPSWIHQFLWISRKVGNSHSLFLSMEAIVRDWMCHQFYSMEFLNNMYFLISFAKGQRVTILEGILKTFVELENGKSKIFR